MPKLAAEQTPTRITDMGLKVIWEKNCNLGREGRKMAEQETDDNNNIVRADRHTTLGTLPEESASQMHLKDIVDT